MVRTEDTGKEFEMAICHAKTISYDGKYKYSMSLAHKLIDRLLKALENITKIKHIASHGSPNDFLISENFPEFLSAKTTKKTGKIAPQVIGQANPNKLCTYLCIEYSSNFDLKAYIYSNYVRLLQLMEHFTFYNKKIVYYNKYTDILQTILKKQDICWNDFKYTWTRSSLQDWKNSNTLKIKYEDKDISLCEVQFHSRSRKNVVLRWYFDNLLEIMCSKFEILKF
jgi:hypothetical protein